MGRAVPPGLTKYEQMLPQEQRKQMKLLGRGTVPTIIIEGAEQKASTRAWLLGRAVPPTTCREMGGSFTVTLSQTQNILPKQEPKESHRKENMMRRAKPKSSYLKTISNLENLENIPKNRKLVLLTKKVCQKFQKKLQA